MSEPFISPTYRHEGQFLYRLYLSVLGREPDKAGYVYWFDKIRAGLDLGDLAYYFTNSAELKLKYPAVPSLWHERLDRTVSSKARDIAPGIAGIVHDLPSAGVHVVYANANKYRARVRHDPTTRRPPGYYGGTVAINGNWYSAAYEPDGIEGLAIDDGTLYHGLFDPRTGYVGFSTTVSGYTVVDIGNFHEEDSVWPMHCQNLVSGKTILSHGIPAPWLANTTDTAFTRAHRRSLVGHNIEGDLIIIVSTRALDKDMMIKWALNTGMYHAVALDGGGSSNLYLDGEGVVTSNRPRHVRNQLIITSA